MKILLLAPYYPHAGHSFSGIFHENFAFVLREFCDTVEVLAPHPYAPRFASWLAPRWQSYGEIPPYELRNGVPVYRPAFLQLPRMGKLSWPQVGAVFSCLRTARDMHRRAQFDAIISADLLAVGDIAWKVGKALGIPASGWAIGGDMRFSSSSRFGRSVIRAIKNLDTVFYQSQELLDRAAELMGLSCEQMPLERHVVLPRGILPPPSLPKTVRRKVRRELEITDDRIIVLFVGRIVRDKGIYELIEAAASAAARNWKITCVLVGSMPAFDDTMSVEEKLKQSPGLKEQVKLLPSCDPDKVWEYLCAADIFAFPSHQEGMPNSLLEAMAMAVPSVAFGIPPVLEIEGGTEALVTVPPFDAAAFAAAILRLAASAEERMRLGERGKARVLDRFMMRNNIVEVLSRISQAIERRRSVGASFETARKHAGVPFNAGSGS